MWRKSSQWKSKIRKLLINLVGLDKGRHFGTWASHHSRIFHHLNFLVFLNLILHKSRQDFWENTGWDDLVDLMENIEPLPSHTYIKDECLKWWTSVSQATFLRASMLITQLGKVLLGRTVHQRERRSQSDSLQRAHAKQIMCDNEMTHFSLKSPHVCCALLKPFLYSVPGNLINCRLVATAVWLHWKLPLLSWCPMLRLQGVIVISKSQTQTASLPKGCVWQILDKYSMGIIQTLRALFSETAWLKAQELVSRVWCWCRTEVEAKRHQRSAFSWALLPL